MSEPSLTGDETVGPALSVIVPVHNGARYLPQCLDALLASAGPGVEIIVSDDGSEDESSTIALARGVKLVRNPSNAGPSAARNAGVQASSGETLLFVDADVAVRPGTVPAILNRFANDPGLAAVFGSYDDSPAETNFCSQYKNLLHHWVHQTSAGPISTFWSGCGAVRRSVFESVGGFDEDLRCMHDIELGDRISRSGRRILLDPAIQGTHLKRWTFGSLLSADIFCRAVPWTLLMLRNGRVSSELNLKPSQRASAAILALGLLLLPLALFEPRLLLVELLLCGAIFLLNRPLYAFFLRLRGLRFALLSFGMQLLYYAYSGATFVICWALFRLGLAGKREPLAGARTEPLSGPR